MWSETRVVYFGSTSPKLPNDQRYNFFTHHLNPVAKRLITKCMLCVGQIPPVIPTPKYYLIHITRNDLSFLSTVQKETPPLLVLEIQHRIVNVLAEYVTKISMKITPTDETIITRTIKLKTHHDSTIPDIMLRYLKKLNETKIRENFSTIYQVWLLSC